LHRHGEPEAFLGREAFDCLQQTDIAISWEIGSW
jgi:hypothetical protein